MGLSAGVSYQSKRWTQSGKNDAVFPATQPGKFATQPGKFATQPGKNATQPGKNATQPGKNGAITPTKSIKLPFYQHQPQRGGVGRGRSFALGLPTSLYQNQKKKTRHDAKLTDIGRPRSYLLICCLPPSYRSQKSDLISIICPNLLSPVLLLTLPSLSRV